MNSERAESPAEADGGDGEDEELEDPGVEHASGEAEQWRSSLQRVAQAQVISDNQSRP